MTNLNGAAGRGAKNRSTLPPTAGAGGASSTPAREHDMYSRILVPVDGSPTSERGLQEATAIARAMKSTLVLLHVIDDFPYMMEMATVIHYEDNHRALMQAGQQLLERCEAALDEAGVAHERVLREVKATAVADVIAQEVQDRRCDLIVMGTHGRRGLSRLTLGSDAELVVRQSGVPVLLVRGAGA